MFDIEDTLPL